MERKEICEEIRKTIEAFAAERHKCGEPTDVYFPGVQNDIAISIANAIIPDGVVILTKEELARRDEDKKEIVYCKDCKFYNLEDSTTENTCRCDGNKLWQPVFYRPYTKPNEFCSRGVRK